MISHRFAHAITLLIAVLFAPLVSAQLKEPTAEQIAKQKNSYEAEKKAALEQKFSPQSFEQADALIKRAQLLLEKKNFREAFKTYRDARWKLPYVPPDLPKHVVRVFGQTRMRHGEWVNAVAFNKEGTKLASASKDGSVKIWNLENGREIRTYRGHKDNVRGVAWSADEKWIASAGGKEIHIWNAETGELKHTLKGHETFVNTVAFRPDGKALASGSDDFTLRVWDVEKGSEIVNLGKQSALIYQVTWSPNGKLVAAVNGDGQLNVWNPELPKGMQMLVLGINVHSLGAYGLAYQQDGKAIYTVGGDKVARQIGAPGPNGDYVAGTGSRQKEFNQAGGGHAEFVTAVAISPDGKTLVTGSKDNSIRVWDVASAKVVRTLQGHTDEITALAFSSDGTTLASASKDQNIRVWTLDLTDSHRNFAEHTGYVWSAVFSSDGALMASAGADKLIRIWDVNAGTVKTTLPGHGVAVTALAFSDDNTKLLSAGGDKLIKLWDVKEGKLIRDFKGHTAPVMAVALTKDATQILSGSADKTAKLWNAQTGEAKATFPDCKAPVSAVAIAPNGRGALIGSADGMLRFCDLSDGIKEKARIQAHVSGVSAVAYAPQGNRIVTCGGDRLIKLWNAPENGTATVAAELKGHSQPVSSVAFSPDGRFIVSGGGDLVVRVWNAQTLAELRALRGHTEWVSSVAFSADSKFIVSASVDKTVKIWELSQEETAPPVGHTRVLRTLAVDPSGKWLASGSEDHTIKLWNLETGFEEATLAGHSKAVTALAFDPKGDRLLSGGEDKKLRQWNWRERREFANIDADEVPTLSFSAKGDKVLAWFLRPGTANQKATIAQVFDATLKPIHQQAERDKDVRCLAFSTDGEMVAMGFADGVVRLWLVEKNERIGGDLPAHQKGLGDLVITPDKSRLVTADEESEIKIWDLKKREAVKTFQAHKQPLWLISMAPNGKKFVSVGANGEVKLWAVEDGKELRSWDIPTPVKNVTFTPDSKFLITANGDTTLYMLELP